MGGAGGGGVQGGGWVGGFRQMAWATLAGPEGAIGWWSQSLGPQCFSLTLCIVMISSLHTSSSLQTAQAVLKVNNITCAVTPGL